MIIVTSGARFLDIDAYACCVAYAELLNLLGKPAKAVSTAPFNESITRTLRALPASFEASYQPTEDDTFIIMDLSNPKEFDTIVDESRVVGIFDHHTGHEAYWAEKLGENSHIEFIGAAATLVFEAWQAAGKLDQMSQASAQLIAAGILDNTLNFGANVTTERDRVAYQTLAKHAPLDDAWVAGYFSECQELIETDLTASLQGDTKFLSFDALGEELLVGQLVVWNPERILAHDKSQIAQYMAGPGNKWFVNIVGIAEGRSYFLSSDSKVKDWLSNLLHVSFDGDVAKADRLWLRKEVVKAAEA